MDISYKFVVKKLKEDDRGYASTLFLEMQGASAEGVTKLATAVVSFGGTDYKPKESWSQDQIDSIAESHRKNLELTISNQFAQGK